MEIGTKTKFDVGEDGMMFSTQSNGDKIKITGIHLDAENAATLAYLINSGVTLEVRVKEKGI